MRTGGTSIKSFLYILIRTDNKALKDRFNACMYDGFGAFPTDMSPYTATYEIEWNGDPFLPGSGLDALAETLDGWRDLIRAYKVITQKIEDLDKIDRNFDEC